MYHFIGIKGAGMSALAQMLKGLGYEVQGSDKPDHFFTEIELIAKDIPIFAYSADHIQEGMIIVRGNVISDEHEEVQRALELGLKIYSYQEMLALLTAKFQTIGVSGCHGKTTTSAMLSHVLTNITGCNYLIGDGTGYGNPDNTYFVLESCEYKRHFLAYNPAYVVITNIDLDHVDYYHDIDDVILAYQEFANKASKMVIACGDDPYTRSLDVKKPIFYYGVEEDNDIFAKNIEYKSTGTSFEVMIEGNYYGSYDLPIYGKHMLLDALAVIAVCYYERLESKSVSKTFKTFSGARRRFSETVVGDTVLMDDYAHHPNEMRAVIQAVKQKYSDKKVIAVFQPHTYSRTQEFALEIQKVLNMVDFAYVMDIHGSREKQEDFPLITADWLLSGIENADHITLDEAQKLLKHKGNVILFMSPNDISKLEMSYQTLLSN